LKGILSFTNKYRSNKEQFYNKKQAKQNTTDKVGSKTQLVSNETNQEAQINTRTKRERERERERELKR